MEVATARAGTKVDKHTEGKNKEKETGERKGGNGEREGKNQF